MNILLYLGVILIFGTTWIAIAIQQMSDQIPVTTAVFWRFSVAALALFLWLKLAKRSVSLDIKSHLRCMVQGVCMFGVNFLCFYTAVHWINSGLESVIFSMAILFNAVNSWLFFGQKPVPLFYPALACGMTGMVLLFWPQIVSAQHSASLLAGIGLSALGTLGFSLGNMLVVAHQKAQQDIRVTTAWGMVYGSLLMAAITLLTGHSLRPSTQGHWLAAVGYLAIVGSALGFCGYFLLVKRVGATSAAWTTLFFPLIALFISTLFEGMVWQWMSLLGLVVLLMANLLMFWRPRSANRARSSDKQSDGNQQLRQPEAKIE